MKKNHSLTPLLALICLSFTNISTAKIIFSENFSNYSNWRYETHDVPTQCVSAVLNAVPGYRSNQALGITYQYDYQQPICVAKNHYFTMTTNVDLINPKAAQIKIKANNNTTTALRIIDETGQTFQFKGYRTIESTGAQDWATLRFDLTQPTLYWGGQNTGTPIGKIKSISILTEASPITTPQTSLQGNVAYDTFEIYDSFDGIYTLTGNKPSNVRFATTSMSRFGNRLGIAHFIAPDRISQGALPLPLAAQAGFSFVRTDLFWQIIEKTKQNYDFSQYTALAKSITDQGMGILFILDYDNSNYDLRTTDGQKAFSNFAVAATKQFQHIPGVRFEIWNEPDIVNGTPNEQNNVWVGKAKEFSLFAKQVAAAMRQANPNVEVAIGAPSYMNFNYLNGVYANAGDVGQASAVGIHGYRNDIPETLTTDVITLQAILRDRVGSQAPMWMTEWAYPHQTWPKGVATDSPSSQLFQQRQAAYQVRQILTQWWLNLPVITQYSLVDTGYNSANYSSNQGLLKPSTPNPLTLSQFEKKPGYYAIQTFKYFTNQYQLKSAVNDLPFGLNALWLENQNNNLMIAWHEQTMGESTLQIPQTRFSNATNMFGQSIAANLNNGYYRITINGNSGPVYIILKK